MKSLTAMMSSRGSHFSWGCQGLGLPFLPQPLLADCSGRAPRFRPAQPFTQLLSCWGRGWGSSQGTAPRPLGPAIHCWGCCSPVVPSVASVPVCCTRAQGCFGAVSVSPQCAGWGKWYTQGPHRKSGSPERNPLLSPSPCFGQPQLLQAPTALLPSGSMTGLFISRYYMYFLRSD